MAETILSYLLAEESRIRKGFRKKRAVWDQEKTASLLYPWVGISKVAITTVHFPEGNSSGDLGSWGHNCLNRVKNFCSPALRIDLRGSIVLDQGG